MSLKHQACKFCIVFTTFIGLQILQLCFEFLESKHIWSSQCPRGTYQIQHFPHSTCYMLNIRFINRTAKYPGGKILLSMFKMPTFHLCNLRFPSLRKGSFGKYWVKISWSTIIKFSVLKFFFWTLHPSYKRGGKSNLLKAI